MLILNEQELRKHSELPATTPLYVLPSIDSTNTFLLKKIPAMTPAFCLAETQTQGRGQQGRPWVSPKAQNIYLSYLTYTATPLHQLQDMSIKVGEVLLNYLKTLELPELRLKWPNDILCKQQKLAGILVETKAHQDLSALVIGIGLNVNMTDTSETINQAWTSLKKITGKTYDLNNIAADLIKILLTNLPSPLVGENSFFPLSPCGRRLR